MKMKELAEVLEEEGLNKPYRYLLGARLVHPALNATADCPCLVVDYDTMMGVPYYTFTGNLPAAGFPSTLLSVSKYIVPATLVHQLLGVHCLDHQPTTNRIWNYIGDGNYITDMSQIQNSSRTDPWGRELAVPFRDWEKDYNSEDEIVEGWRYTLPFTVTPSPYRGKILVPAKLLVVND